jgi:hypothetical protein
MDTTFFCGLRITLPRPALPPPDGKPTLLPPLVTTASNHNTTHVPALLRDPLLRVRRDAADWLRRAAAQLPLSGREVQEILAAGERQPRPLPGAHWPCSFTELSAVAALLELLPSGKYWVVLGLGLMPATVDEMIAELDSVPHGIKQLLPQEPEGSPLSLARERRQHPEGGTFLGFDLLEAPFEFDLGCSGHCTQLEQTVFEHLGVRPNCHGLIDRWEDAHLAAERATDEEWGEPIGYWPVALYRYRSGASR